MKQTTAVSLDKLDYYHVLQPIIDTTMNEVFGYELLLRSNQIKNPEILFQQAKEQNQVYELDMHSIQLAFQTMNKYKDWFNDYHLFINVLPATLSKAKALDEIKKWSESSSVPINQIVFEITEDKKEEELIMCQATIGSMKRQGFLIAVDDLGKGDSTLTYAIELKPHVIKLDRKFAKDLANSPLKQKEIEAMGKFFGEGKLLILEGIETEADLVVAKQLGIQYVQGFYLGKPELPSYYINQK